jgi:hypothetical protein
MRHQRGKGWSLRFTLAFLIGGLLMLFSIYGVQSNAWNVEHEPAFDFLFTNLTIFSAGDRHIIGHAWYTAA